MTTRQDRRAHIVGLAVGGAIGGLLLLVSGPDPSTGTSANASFGAATFAGGAVGGWLLGPAAWRARSRGAWLRTVAGLAAVAVLVGDAVVVTMLTLHDMTNTDPVPGLAQALGSMLSLYLLGLVILGWLYFVAALLVGSIWALIVAAIRRTLEAKPDPS